MVRDRRIQEPQWRFRSCTRSTRARKAQLAAATEGYLVTGGGREPYYGCWDCIPRAEEMTPGQWKLLAEFPGPEARASSRFWLARLLEIPGLDVPTAWRAEPVRIWERIGSPDGAG